MYLALIILPLLGSIASGLVRSTLGFSSSTPSRDIRNKQRVPKKLLHSNANCKGYYYTGFCDAEGCFRVKIVRNKKYSTAPGTADGGCYADNVKKYIIQILLLPVMRAWVNVGNESGIKLV